LSSSKLKFQQVWDKSNFLKLAGKQVDQTTSLEQPNNCSMQTFFLQNLAKCKPFPLHLATPFFANINPKEVKKQ